MLATAENLVLDTSLEIHIEDSKILYYIILYYIILYYIIHRRYAFLDEGSAKLTLLNGSHSDRINGDKIHSLFENNSNP
jgi:hypothetical protein